jgi:hypothetical protein
MFQHVMPELAQAQQWSLPAQRGDHICIWRQAGYMGAQA